MSTKSATVILDGLIAGEIAVEVTHRSAWRLFGLPGMTPVRDATTAPRRPEPGRGRGRPSFAREDLAATALAPLPAPIGRFEWPAIDYGALEEAVAQAKQAIQSSRNMVDYLCSREPVENGQGTLTS